MLDRLTPLQRHTVIVVLAAVWGAVLFWVLPIIHVPDALAMPLGIITTIITLTVTKLTTQYGVGKDPVEAAVIAEASGRHSAENIAVITDAAATLASDAISSAPAQNQPPADPSVPSA